MEMGLIVATFVMSALSALCSVAALVVLLIMATPKEEGESPLSPDGDIPLLGKGGTPSATAKEKPPDDVGKRRRVAVQAKEHSNFMNYDGTPQQKIDPALILGE